MKVTLIKVKQIICDTIGKRIDEVRIEKEKYNILSIQCDIEEQRLFNIQTEICINLDKEFKK